MASFREIDQAFPRVFLLTHKGAFCRVCSNTTVSLSGQRNPFGNAKQHVESKGHKAKMQAGSSIVSSKDISSYFLAPPQKKWQEANVQATPKPSLCHGFYCEDYSLTIKGEKIQTNPKLLLSDTKPGTDEGKQSWYPEPFYTFTNNDTSSGLSTELRGTFRSTECKRVSCKFISADGICSSCANIPNLPSFRKRLLLRMKKTTDTGERDLSCVRN